MEDLEKRPQLTKRDKRFINARSIMDFGMGLLWTGMGFFLIFIKQFNTGLEAQFDDPVMKIFGAICIVYGAFRIYRAIKKNYFK
ncbi:MAG: hypothetical protein ABIP68_05480 [Ferruginibacter sp.]